MEKELKLYIFFRGKDWYPIELIDNEDAIKNAEYNKGTTKVEDVKGNIIWCGIKKELNNLNNK